MKRSSKDKLTKEDKRFLSIRQEAKKLYGDGCDFWLRRWLLDKNFRSDDFEKKDILYFSKSAFNIGIIDREEYESIKEEI